MKSFLAGQALLVQGSSVRQFEGYLFSDFEVEFGKQYGNDRSERQALFERELDVVKAHNARYAAGEVTWWATINKFSDMTEEEFSSMNGYASKQGTDFAGSLVRLGSVANPSRKDWREEGVVTPVKNQGGCGSCWAFAATECVESHYMIAAGGDDGTVLAPQYYVNCVKNPQSCGGTGGCQGAIAELAFNLTAQVGIPLEKDLPYTGSNGNCGSYPEAVTCDGYVQVPANDASELETALATKGPVAVSVAANWGRYAGGIYEGGCSSSGCTINHAVLAVGYDQDYWLIRNSWGSSWGEGGYIRLTRSHDTTTYTDTNPGSGFACKPYPSTQQVMGESGVLSDSAYPTNTRKVSSAVAV
jgi:cathepsin L